MKSKTFSEIVSCAVALILLMSCNPEPVDNRLHIKTFFTMQNAAISKEKTYKKGVEAALNDFAPLAENVIYENLPNINRENIKAHTNEAQFFVNVGTLDEGLQTEIQSNNLMPALFSYLEIKDAQYTSEFDQFDINPDLTNEAKLIAEHIPDNAFIVYSNEKIFEKMHEAFLENYPEENINGTMLLPPKSNAFSEIVSELLSKDFAVLLLFTNGYDFTNLIYQLSMTPNDKDVYLPSFGKRFFVLPPNIMQASFHTFVFAYHYRLLLKNEELPANTALDINVRDYPYFLDGYSATHFLLKSYENSHSNIELINNMHAFYDSRNLSGSFIPFS